MVIASDVDPEIASSAEEIANDSLQYADDQDRAQAAEPAPTTQTPKDSILSEISDLEHRLAKEMILSRADSRDLILRILDLQRQILALVA